MLDQVASHQQTQVDCGALSLTQAVVDVLREDRPGSPDIEALDRLITQGTFDGTLP